MKKIEKDQKGGGGIEKDRKDMFAIPIENVTYTPFSKNEVGGWADGWIVYILNVKRCSVCHYNDDKQL